MRNDRQAHIEQVAGIIAEWSGYLAGWGGPEAAEEQNSSEGWSYNVRLPSHEYITTEDYTRIEGHRLNKPDLARAVALGQSWHRGVVTS